jgi:hypothetical protein
VVVWPSRKGLCTRPVWLHRIHQVDHLHIECSINFSSKRCVDHHVIIWLGPVGICIRGWHSSFNEANPIGVALANSSAFSMFMSPRMMKLCSKLECDSIQLSIAASSCFRRASSFRELPGFRCTDTRTKSRFTEFGRSLEVANRACLGYHITIAGRSALGEKKESWSQLTTAITQIMEKSI